MTKEMIISSNGFERRIAILDDGVLTEYYVERVDDESEGMVGNIYKGRVTKVLPGMQSAFVAIGLERDAFLYVADVFEGDDVEFETPVRESKRPASVPKTTVAAQEEKQEEVTDDEVDEALETIKQTESKRSAFEPERVSSAGQRGYDEQVAELIESLAEDLDEPSDGALDEEGNDSEVDLKDALIEVKLIEAVQQEELDEEVPEESLASTVRVGSLWAQLPSDSSLERIVDEPVAEPKRVSSSLELEASVGEPEEKISARDEVESEESGEDESEEREEKVSARDEVESEESGEDELETSGESPEAESTSAPSHSLASASSSSMAADSQPVEAESEPPLEDGKAAVRYRTPRAEFAAHRKVRRRRSHRTRPSNTDSEDASAGSNSGMPTITELLNEGQELLVQVAKEPIGAKGARVTSHIAIPGRYLVYMPTTEHVGVSRRIPSHAERIRLRKLAGKLRTRHKAAGGFIVRTAAEGCDEDQLQEDMKYLVRVWTDLRRRAEKTKAPALMYREVDLVHRILRDRLSGDFSAIRVDNEQDYTQIIDFVDHFQPELLGRIKLYTRSVPIFEQYGVQPEIDKSIRPRVWLKSGGYIVINQTEALVAIDVNTGKFVGKTNRFEDTITRTNMEAAREIARQLRLRDLGGIIVLDFIDMEERKNRQKVMQVLEEELRKDRAPAKVLSFNDFGLVAITRKRVKQSLERTLCEPCPHCHGSGMVKSPQTICYEILDEARRLTDEVEKAKEAILRVHPVVAQALRQKHFQVMEAIESYLKGKITLETDQLLHQEQFDLALL